MKEMRSAEFGMRNNQRSRGLTPLNALRLVLAWALAFGNAPAVFAKEFGVVEDLYVGRNTITPYGGFGTYANLLLYSQDFSQTAWTKTNATVAANVTAPNGAANGATTLSTGATAPGSAAQEIPPHY